MILARTAHSSAVSQIYNNNTHQMCPIWRNARTLKSGCRLISVLSICHSLGVRRQHGVAFRNVNATSLTPRQKWAWKVLSVCWIQCRMELVRFPAEERCFSPSKVSAFCPSIQLHVEVALTLVSLPPPATHRTGSRLDLRPVLDPVEKKSLAQADSISSDVQPVDQS